MSDNSTVERNRIRKEVKLRVARGEAKQYILETMSQGSKDTVYIARQLSKTPSLVMLKRYRPVTVALFILPIIILTQDAFAFKHAFFPDSAIWDEMIHMPLPSMWPLMALFAACALLDCVACCFVPALTTKAYIVMIVRAAFALGEVITVRMFYDYAATRHDYFALLLALVALALALMLKLWLTPRRVPTTIEVAGIDGTVVPKVVYVFPD